MRLTSYSDYSLRVLVYLAQKRGELATIQQIADDYQISKNHLTKVVHNLVKLGYVSSIRGRSGGIVLAKDPKEVSLGEVLSHTEEDFNIVECFDPVTNTCTLSANCRLKMVVSESLAAFLKVMHQYSLHDIAKAQDELQIVRFSD